VPEPLLGIVTTETIGTLARLANAALADPEDTVTVELLVDSICCSTVLYPGLLGNMRCRLLSRLWRRRYVRSGRAG